MKRFIYIFAVAAMVAACTDSSKGTDIEKQPQNYDIITDIIVNQQVDRMLQDIDQKEQAGSIQSSAADYWRGVAYDMARHYRLASYYYQRAFDAYEKPIRDWDGYADTGYRLTCMQTFLNDYDAALRTGMELLACADSLTTAGSTAFPRGRQAWILFQLAECQTCIGRDDEARANSLRAYEMLTGSESTPTDRMLMCADIVDKAVAAGRLDEADEWLRRMEKAHGELAAEEVAGIKHRDLLPEYAKCISLFKALILQARGRTAEAAAAYEAVTDTAIQRHAGNLELSVRYLMAAGRYDEAIAFMNDIDTYSPDGERPRMTLELISERMVPRYEANLKAGHTAEALSTATAICAAIDSALTTQRIGDATEISVIYETQQKDRALERHEAKAHLHRIIIIALSLILAIAAFALWRIIAAHRRLHQKNHELFDTIQQMKRSKDEAQRHALTTAPAETQTATQKLYHRLVELMMEQHPYTDSNLTRESLAQMLGTNYNTVANAIRECADGKTLGDFLDDWRLRHAAQMLGETDEPVGIIIEESGFSSRSHFNTLFRDCFKMTPSEYRQIAKEVVKGA